MTDKPPTHRAGIKKVVSHHRVFVYSACTILAVIFNYFFGKEMAWDLLHYHLYLGFSALNDRFGQDYFAAGSQSYFNPYAYVPFYALVRLGLPALLVGTVLALLQSVVLWLTYELAWYASPDEKPGVHILFSSCVTILAFMNPILLQQIGSSFSDITTGGLVLGGWLLLVQAIRRPNALRVLIGALLLGFSVALKPTNAVHALSAFFLVAFVPLPLVGRLRSLACFAAALAAGFLLVATPWSHRMAGMFTNPTFPLLSGAFKAHGLADSLLRTYHSIPHRFIPDSLTDALVRPFAIAGTGPMIHEELSAPDIRYTLLIFLSLIFLIARAWKSVNGAATLEPVPRSESAARVLAALGCAFAFDWVLWLTASGNGRYFIPMACVAAVLALALLFRLLSNHTLGRNGILFALFLAQASQLALGTDFRWNATPWGGPWFNVEIPAKLAREANLYLSIGGPSNSFLVPFLPKGSGFINVSSNSVLGPDGAPALRVRAMVRQSAPHVRVLLSGEGIYPDVMKREPRQSDVDDVVRMFGLRVDVSDCETIAVGGLRWSIWRAPNSSIPAPMVPRGKLRYTRYFASCHLIPDTRDDSQEMAERRAVDVVFDRLEDACPALFQPPRRQTEHVNQIWLRRYQATDLTAWVGNGEVKISDAIRNPSDIDLGREEAWSRGPPNLECGRRHGVYFARLSQNGH